MTAPSWAAARYPVITVCGFCACPLTIALDDNGTTTVTKGHAHDCIQNPARTHRRGSAA